MLSHKRILSINSGFMKKSLTERKTRRLKADNCHKYPETVFHLIASSINVAINSDVLLYGKTQEVCLKHLILKRESEKS